MDYEKMIDELIEKKLAAALEALDKQRAQAAAAYESKRKSAKAEGESQKRGAYADYAKNVDPTGYNAEVMAAMGLDKSGKTETAKVGYYNVYQNALAAIRNKTDEELAALSEQEREALAALDEADTKARDNAYTLLLEEQVRRQENAVKQAEADRKHQIEMEELAIKKAQAARAASSSSSQKSESEETVIGYPTSGTDAEKYKWIKTQLEFLVNNVAPDEDNPRLRILESAQKYLDLAFRDLSNDRYFKLLDLVV